MFLFRVPEIRQQAALQTQKSHIMLTDDLEVFCLYILHVSQNFDSV
jgi:hypothetical protein